MLRFSNRQITLAAIALLGFCAVPSRANDGGIAWGGSPKLLSSHPGVAMQSELITMTVGKESVTVDCRFVFKNSGRATTVRMGFPDEGSGDQDPDEEVDSSDPNWRKTPPQATFTSFKSWVNGVPTKTTVIRADEPGSFWHAKTVYFPASSTRIVRDLYTVPLGSQIMGSGDGAYSEASYTLHTGASWHGPIGRSEVVITFKNNPNAQALVPVAAKSLKKDVGLIDWRTLKRGTVVYTGPSAPSVNGKTLRFVRTHWTPTPKDDIFLAFGAKGSGDKLIGQ